MEACFYYMVTGINIRVYGLWLNASGEVLVSREQLGGKAYLKFPGGGLVPGEGLIDALRREWREELDKEIRVIAHFYTTDYFQPSAWDNSQVISVYYLVSRRGSLPCPIPEKRKSFIFWRCSPGCMKLLACLLISLSLRCWWSARTAEWARQGSCRPLAGRLFFQEIHLQCYFYQAGGVLDL